MNNTIIKSVIETVFLDLQEICGCGNVFSYHGHEEYGSDQTGGIHYPFDVLVKPGSTEEVAAVMKICSHFLVPVTARGGGSGVTGGALPVCGGVVLSLERLNKILSINAIDGYVVAEAGVITKDLCEAVAETGYYFPVQPTSSSYSFVGGNVAENAGSVNSCKYGKTADYLLNTEIVLAGGDILWTGSNVKKSSSGLNLTSLMAGSEGILGIITKVVYRLVVKPSYEISLLAAFTSVESALEVTYKANRLGFRPVAFELIGENAIRMTADYLSIAPPLTDLHITTHLLITLEEDNKDALYAAAEKITGIIEQHTKEEILVADNEHEKQRLWQLRNQIGSALIAEGRTYRDIDICVPLSTLHAYIDHVNAVCVNAGIQAVLFGHALDGNLHAMLVTKIDDRSQHKKDFDTAVSAIYSFAGNQLGAISGEHGIGMLQKDYLALQSSPFYIETARKIKQVFDPNGILNPGKVL